MKSLLYYCLFNYPWIIEAIRVCQINDETQIGYRLEQGTWRQTQSLIFDGLIDILQERQYGTLYSHTYTQSYEHVETCWNCSIYAPAAGKTINKLKMEQLSLSRLLSHCLCARCYLIKQKQFNLIFMTVWGPVLYQDHFCHFCVHNCNDPSVFYLFLEESPYRCPSPHCTLPVVHTAQHQSIYSPVNRFRDTHLTQRHFEWNKTCTLNLFPNGLIIKPTTRTKKKDWESKQMPRWIIVVNKGKINAPIRYCFYHLYVCD